MEKNSRETLRLQQIVRDCRRDEGRQGHGGLQEEINKGLNVPCLRRKTVGCCGGGGGSNFPAWILQKQKEGERPPNEKVSPSEKG